MNIAIVYDSVFGNTGKVAAAIAKRLEATHAVRLLTVQEARGTDLTDTDLLIVGSPTRGFRPTPMISEYVEKLTANVAGQSAAVFDTRIDLETIRPSALRWVVDAGGYAAERIASSLARHGFTLKGAPGGFLVSGEEGPLKDHELERAADWSLTLTT
jgi:flavodoxin